MPDQRSIIDYINDILDAMSKAEKFIGNMAYAEFEEDEKTFFAVVRAFEIIGEASTHIQENLREEYQDIPWGRRVGMRNVLIHRYFGITRQILWNTIKVFLGTGKPSDRESPLQVLVGAGLRACPKMLHFERL